MPTLDLPENYWQILKSLLLDYAPDALVWAYGSRVSGRAHASSDLDLVLRNPVDLSVPQKNLLNYGRPLAKAICLFW